MRTHSWITHWRSQTIAATALALVFANAAPGFADSSTGCDFAANGSTPTCTAPLSGSTFEGGDGNLVPNGGGSATDWSNVAGLQTGVDTPSGKSDNSFGQGTKEDDPNVTVVDGSIPPNKSDLTRFYAASSFASSSNFLYLAWERTNVLGTANMDFEINQATTPGLSDAGAHTINRTAGDLLVTFDFNNGGGMPVLGLLSWLTSGSPSQCFSSNSLPCWGDRVNLNSSDSEGAVNNLDSVHDPIASQDLPALTFGETAINLTAAGVFPAGVCKAFGSAFLKSRSSSSFTAELKDYVAPVPINISNCGEVRIIKHTAPRGLNQSFSFTSTIPNPASGSTTPSCTADSTPSAFSLNDNGNTTADNTANTEDCKNVPAGDYTVTEGAEPAGFTFGSLSCTATGSGTSGHQDSTTPAKADITIAPNGLVTCTYTNNGLGAILVTKTGKNVSQGSGQHPLSGATFTVNGVAKTTDANGHACFPNLTVGQSYTVTETKAPSGYAIDTASKSVTVTGSATCTVGTPTPVSFTDSPLTDLTVTAKSEVTGATKSTITCVKQGTSTGVGNSPQGPADPATVTANGLKPGNYTCTVNVDP